MNWTSILKLLTDYGVLGVIGFLFLRLTYAQQQAFLKLFDETIKNNQDMLLEIKEKLIFYETINKELLEQLKEIKLGFQGINESVIGLYTINNDNTNVIKEFVNQTKQYDPKETKLVLLEFLSNTIFKIYFESVKIIDKNHLTQNKSNILDEIKLLIDTLVRSGRNRLTTLSINEKLLKKLFQETDKLRDYSVVLIRNKFSEMIEQLDVLEKERDVCNDLECYKKINSKITQLYLTLKRDLYIIAEELILKSGELIERLIEEN